MKNYVSILFIIIIFASCTRDPRESVIAAYEQTTGDTKTDLSLKVLEIIDLGYVIAQDSLDILMPEFIEKRDKNIETLKQSIKRDEEQIQDYKNSGKKYGLSNKSMIEMYENLIEISRNLINIYQTDCKGSFLEWHYNRISELKKDTSRVLFNKTKVSYSIKNPLLNYAKQEITKTYMFTPDNDSILGVID